MRMNNDGGVPADHGLSRRDFLKAGAVGAVGLLAANHFGIIGTFGHEGDSQHFPPTFENPAAEAIADELHINPSSYFIVPAETMQAMTNGQFKQHDKLVPTFAPGVSQYEPELAVAAEATGLPINFLATIATIESAGDAEAVSGADALGLLQVVPLYHMDGYIKNGYLPAKASYQDYQQAQAGHKSKVSLGQYQEALLDPQASITVGAEYLQACLESAQSAHPDLDPDSPIVYAWAAAGYNGGIGLTDSSFEDMPEQSQLYVNHVIRILMDVEIAARLSERGMPDDAVVAAMWSNQMNARAYGYGQLADVADYDIRADLMAKPEPGLKKDGHAIVLHAGHHTYDYGQQAHDAYEDYLSGGADVPTPDHRYDIPAAPGLRIWLEGGGADLFDSVAVNADWRVGQG